jgi:hypothetical protein
MIALEAVEPMQGPFLKRLPQSYKWPQGTECRIQRWPFLDGFQVHLCLFRAPRSRPCPLSLYEPKYSTVIVWNGLNVAILFLDVKVRAKSIYLVS